MSSLHAKPPRWRFPGPKNRRNAAIGVGAATTLASALLIVTPSTSSAAGIADQVLANRDQSYAATAISSPGFSTSSAQVLVAFMASDGPSGSRQWFSSVSGCGLSWRLAARSNAQAGTAEAWTANASSPVTNCSVTATRGAGSYQGSMTVVGFTNAGAVAAAGSNSAPSAPPSVSLTAQQTGSLVYGIGDDWDQAIPRTVPSGQTKVHEYLASVGDTMWTQKVNATTTAGQTVTVNDTAPIGDRFDMVAIEVAPAVTSPSSSPSTSPSSAPTGSPISLWSGSTTPAQIDGNDTQAVELGVRFHSDVPGTVTGIRYYKSTANTGTHTGSLWSSSGSRLATATFTGESASGWQQVTFATPVHIDANTTYVASYHTNSGHYSGDAYYFATNGVTNGPLHADAGQNDVYAYGSGGFPTSSWHSMNYWVDLTFVPDSGSTPSPSPSGSPSSSPTPSPTTSPTNSPTPSPTPSPTGSTPPPGGCANTAGQLICGSPFLSSWAMPLPSGVTLKSNSSTLVNNFTTQIHNYYGNVSINDGAYAEPTYVAGSSTPTVSMGVASGCNNFLSNTGTQVPIPAGAVPATGGDGELIVYQASTDTEWEFWQAKQTGTSSWVACWGGKLTNVKTAKPGLFPAPYGSSATGIPYLGTIPTLMDVQNGAINHAIPIAVVDCNTYVPPANRTDCGSSNSDSIPEGTWFRLNPSLNVNNYNLTPFAKMVFIAMQKYGMIVADQGGALMIPTEDPRDWKNTGHSGTDPLTASYNGQPQYNVFNNMPWGQLQVINPPF